MRTRLEVAGVAVPITRYFSGKAAQIDRFLGALSWVDGTGNVLEGAIQEGCVVE